MPLSGESLSDRSSSGMALVKICPSVVPCRAPFTMMVLPLILIFLLSTPEWMSCHLVFRSIANIFRSCGFRSGWIRMSLGCGMALRFERIEATLFTRVSLTNKGLVLSSVYLPSLMQSRIELLVISLSIPDMMAATSLLSWSVLAYRFEPFVASFIPCTTMLNFLS